MPFDLVVDELGLGYFSLHITPWFTASSLSRVIGVKGIGVKGVKYAGRLSCAQRNVKSDNFCAQVEDMEFNAENLSLWF